MIVFLSIVITAIICIIGTTICIHFLRVSPNVEKTNFYKYYKFNNFMDKSDFENYVDKSDLISFRHEFGETIFEIQKEMDSLRTEIDNLRNENLNNKK